MPKSTAGPEIERLIQLLARLPGLGPRSARRAALHLIKKREPLMAPLEDQTWQILWSSEAPLYGGSGTPPLYRNGNLHIPGESALVLGPGPLAWEIAPELHSEADDSPANG